MGGIGSGNWYRWDTRTTTEQVHSVDIRYLKKKGFLNNGSRGNLSWCRGGERTGSISFKTSCDLITLIYKKRECGESWVDNKEEIKFDKTSCNYGGERKWFLCPHCGKRVAIIYGLNSGFLCRHCYELPYLSQSETYLDRMIRKSRKIRKQLNADIDLDIPIYRKPKGMHWKKFNKLALKEQCFNSIVAIEIESKLMSMFVG